MSTIDLSGVFRLMAQSVRAEAEFMQRGVSPAPGARDVSDYSGIMIVQDYFGGRGLDTLQRYVNALAAQRPLTSPESKELGYLRSQAERRGISFELGMLIGRIESSEKHSNT